MNSSRNSKSGRTARAGSLASSLAAAALALIAASCAPDKMPFSPTETRTFAGGIEVDGKTLNEGYASYMRYCYACHGEEGNGKGPSSYGLRPPPRDFTKGIFKFARLRSSDELPNDDDLIRIVKGGLHGTAMLPWDVPVDELSKILQYIKTFSPKWSKKKKNGEPVKTLDVFEPTADPWTGKEAEAVKLGQELYHFRAECMNCHPGFGTKGELYKLSVEAAKRDPEKFKPVTSFREDLYHSVAKDSPEYGVRLLPPDFTMNPVRSIRDDSKLVDLYRLISYGVYPVMPAWKGAGLSDKDIWALAYYVKSLVDIRGTKEALDLKEKFASQADFKIPQPEPTPAEGDAAPDADKDAKSSDKDAKAADKDAKASDKDAKSSDKDAKASDKKDAKSDKKPADKKEGAAPPGPKAPTPAQ